MKSGMKVVAVSVLAWISLTAMAAEVSLADAQWRFAKDTTGKLQAEAPNFDDSKWERVRVPHDWAISGPFNPKAENGGSGKLPWKGVGWYRREFQIDAGFKGCVFLDFDGVMARPQVYVNGKLAGGWNYGYASFRVDATPFVMAGRNVLAVRADTTAHHSRWYPGAGLYRKVTMRLENRAHFAYNSVVVRTPRVERDEADVTVGWETENAPKGARVEVAVDGAVQGAVRADAGVLAFTLKNPPRWDIDSPNLLRATVRLLDADGAELAREQVRFGVRTIAFPVAEDPKDRAGNGFHLNGRRVQLHGVNLHSDLGLLGMAFDKSAMRRQLRYMKEMGVNALRTSHNIPAPEVLDLCDEMGIVVWDEAFDKWQWTAGRRSEENLERYIGENLIQFVRRDRNHPCVIVWSISNEIEPGKDGDANNSGMTKDRCSLFRTIIRREDATRPVGNGNVWTITRQPKALAMDIWDDLDITGWNYLACYRTLKAKYPRKPVIYTESASAYSSYGYYMNPPAQNRRDYPKNDRQTDAYDRNGSFDLPDGEFAYMEQDAYCCGEFVWTGIDYLGEPTPYWEESRSSYFGIMDLCCVPKDRYWLYRSYWNPSADTLHLLPHWNWRGREGQKVPVYVYTNGDSAELFVNGKSQGMRRKGEPASPKFVNMLAGAKATASSEEREGSTGAHPAKDAIDGNGNSRWCAEGASVPQWLQLELPEPRAFRWVSIIMQRAWKDYGVALSLSDDGKVWRKVFEKKLDEDRKIAFAKPEKAKFLRFDITGSKSGYWASVREVLAGNEQAEPEDPCYAVCDRYRLRWLDVAYEPGEVKVVAYKDGQKLGEKTMRTAEKAVALKAAVEPHLTADPNELTWIQIDAFDAKGVRDPLAKNRVKFALKGPGKILGVGNGDSTAMEAFTKVDSHPMFFGKVVAVVRREGPGELVLEVSSDGLKPDAVRLP